eukprot:SAG25_NODE_6277_length_572_cov_1.752643_1_plen_49_part_10
MNCAGGTPSYNIYSKSKLNLELRLRRSAIESSIAATADSPITKEIFTDH